MSTKKSSLLRYCVVLGAFSAAPACTVGFLLPNTVRRHTWHHNGAHHHHHRRQQRQHQHQRRNCHRRSDVVGGGAVASSLRIQRADCCITNSQHPSFSNTGVVLKAVSSSSLQGQAATPVGYSFLVDNLGCGAYENVTSSSASTTVAESSKSSLLLCEIGNVNGEEEELEPICDTRFCTRIQSGPDRSLDGIKTGTDVLRKIEEVKGIQSEYGNAELYQRWWEPAATVTPPIETVVAGVGDADSTTSASSSLPLSVNVNGDTTSTTNGTQKRKRKETFAVMQFNTLAEGLSSGPRTKTPFVPSELNRRRAITNEDQYYYGGFTNVPNPEIALNFELRRWRLLEVMLANYNYNSRNYDVNEQQKRQEQDQQTKEGWDGFDLIALEEVDRYHSFFLPIMSKFGYSGAFVPKPCAPGISLGWYSDGCALFWKDDTFDLLTENKKGSYLVGNQVYMVLTLHHKKSHRNVVVAVTHLKAQERDENERIRTLQAQELVRHVSDAAEEAAASGMQNGEPADIPIIIMGDFNADPRGEGKTCINSLQTRSSSWPQFRSAYPIDDDDDQQNNNIAGKKEEPPKWWESLFFVPNNMTTRPEGEGGGGSFTTWKTRGTKTVKRIIDYIFHNGCGGDTTGTTNTNDTTDGYNNNNIGFACKRILKVPDEADIDKPGLLPGLRYPSDHMMIASEFELDY